MTTGLDPYTPPRVVPSRAARHAKGRAGRRVSRRGKAFWRELPVLLVIAILLALLVKGFVLQAFFIPSKSMLPTLEVGDRVLVNRLAFRVGEPQHGQVVVFIRPDPNAAPPPQGPLGIVQRAVASGLGNAPPGSEDLIKRVIGVPGDVVAARKGRLLRNGRPVDEPYLTKGTKTSSFGPVRIPPGHLWVMGDNREDSADSRRFGPVPQADLVGRAVVLIWPFDNVGGL
jgi:signal peptidase I